MKEKKYEKRLDFQQKLSEKQSEQIRLLKAKIDKLEEKCKEKDEIIKVVEPMRQEMIENLEEQKRLKKQYKSLIRELKEMKGIIDQEVYRKRWWLIKWFVK